MPDNRSEPYFFAFDTKSKPGFIIGHCVRFETIEIKGDRFDQTKFSILGKDIEKDERIAQMVKCVKGSNY